MGLSPSSSLRSPANSTDSEREASEVRRDEPDEAWLGGRLPISRLIQCSHKEELVDPKLPDSRWILGVQHQLQYKWCKQVSDTQNTIQRHWFFTKEQDNYLQQSCWQTRMEQLHVFDKTRCIQSACIRRLQIWDEHRCHQSSTTAHRWSFYSELWNST